MCQMYMCPIFPNGSMYVHWEIFTARVSPAGSIGMDPQAVLIWLVSKATPALDQGWTSWDTLEILI